MSMAASSIGVGVVLVVVGNGLSSGELLAIWEGITRIGDAGRKWLISSCWVGNRSIRAVGCAAWTVNRAAWTVNLAAYYGHRE